MLGDVKRSLGLFVAACLLCRTAFAQDFDKQIQQADRTAAVQAMIEVAFAGLIDEARWAVESDLEEEIHYDGYWSRSATGQISFDGSSFNFSVQQGRLTSFRITSNWYRELANIDAPVESLDWRKESGRRIGSALFPLATDDWTFVYEGKAGSTYGYRENFRHSGSLFGIFRGVRVSKPLIQVDYDRQSGCLLSIEKMPEQLTAPSNLPLTALTEEDSDAILSNSITALLGLAPVGPITHWEHPELRIGVPQDQPSRSIVYASAADRAIEPGPQTLYFVTSILTKRGKFTVVGDPVSHRVIYIDVGYGGTSLLRSPRLGLVTEKIRTQVPPGWSYSVDSSMPIDGLVWTVFGTDEGVRGRFFPAGQPDQFEPAGQVIVESSRQVMLVEGNEDFSMIRLVSSGSRAWMKASDDLRAALVRSRLMLEPFGDFSQEEQL
jgi:hypothetical protein